MTPTLVLAFVFLFLFCCWRISVNFAFVFVNYFVLRLRCWLFGLRGVMNMLLLLLQLFHKIPYSNISSIQFQTSGLHPTAKPDDEHHVRSQDYSKPWPNHSKNHRWCSTCISQKITIDLRTITQSFWYTPRPWSPILRISSCSARPDIKEKLGNMLVELF